MSDPAATTMPETLRQAIEYLDRREAEAAYQPLVVHKGLYPALYEAVLKNPEAYPPCILIAGDQRVPTRRHGVRK
jgi:hypothetical protein